MLQQVVLQNLVTCNPVAVVAGGTPQYDSNHCITGYSISQKPSSGSSSGGSSGFSGLLNGGGNSSSSSGSWGPSSSSGGFQESSGSSSSMSFNWESSSQQFVSNTGAYYVDQNGNTYQIIMDNQGRAFYKNQYGQTEKIQSEQNSRNVYFTNTQGQRHSLNVDSFGRLSVTNQMTGQLEDIQISSQGHVYFTSQSGEKTYLVASDNRSSQNQNQTQNQNQNQFQGGNQVSSFTNTLGSKSLEGKLYYIDQFNKTHQLFIDQSGGYYMDSNDNIHAISEQGTAYYVNNEDQKVKLLIDRALQVGIHSGQQVEVVQENREGEGFYKNQWGDQTMLVQSSSSQSSDFQGMSDRSQFQQSQQNQSRGGSSQFDNRLTSQSQSSQFMEKGKIYYVLNNQTYDMLITSQECQYKDQFGQLQQVSSQGSAYYVDYQGKKEEIKLSQFGGSVSLSGEGYQVHQNSRGFAFITNQQGQSMFLGSSQMSNLQQTSFEMESSQMSHSQVSLQTGHLYVEDASGQTHKLLIHQHTAFYIDSNQNIKLINSNMKAFFINENNEKTSLTIHEGTVWTQTGAGYKSVLLNSQGQAYYTNAHGVGYELANGREISQSSGSSFSQGSASSSTQGSSSSSTQSSGSSFGGFTQGSGSSFGGSSSGSLFAKFGGGQQSGPPKQPAGCSPVAYVTGGTPVKNSKGCITSYTVGLQLLMI